MADKTDSGGAPAFGTIVRARNGDVIRFDQTGLDMVLSDKVIADIARRLPLEEQVAHQREWIDPAVLGDMDAWDLRRDGEWLLFHANLEGAQGPRLFRRLAEPEGADQSPAVIADGAGPLCGIFSLGGARRATGFDAALAFPWHVLAPADEIGAVGLAGTEAATAQTTLQRLPELTRDAAIADILLAGQFENHRALSLFVTRAESDGSTSIGALGQGLAYANFQTALQSLKEAARRLARPATLYAIGLDFTLEDVTSDEVAYRDGVFDLIAQMMVDVAKAGLHFPPVLAQFDCGTHTLSDHPVLRGQWDLAWQGPAHGLHYTAPGYMFQQDRFGRPDEKALWQMAEMDAFALTALHEGDEWLCPIFLLAEFEPDPAQIRVRARALSDLVIDEADPFRCGADCGFRLSGADNAPALISVGVAADDPQDIILTFDKAPTGDRLEVLYAFGQMHARSDLDYPAACGAIRDSWAAASKTGARLNRWALPAALPVW